MLSAFLKKCRGLVLKESRLKGAREERCFLFKCGMLIHIINQDGENCTEKLIQTLAHIMTPADPSTRILNYFPSKISDSASQGPVEANEPTVPAFSVIVKSYYTKKQLQSWLGD